MKLVYLGIDFLDKIDAKREEVLAVA